MQAWVIGRVLVYNEKFFSHDNVLSLLSRERDILFQPTFLRNVITCPPDRYPPAVLAPLGARTAYAVPLSQCPFLVDRPRTRLL